MAFLPDPIYKHQRGPLQGGERIFMGFLITGPFQENILWLW